jgi:GTPase SAR1 family protein
MSNQEIHADAIFKIILLGDAGVGKSSLLQQFTEENNITNTRSSSELLEFKIKDYELKEINKVLRLQIWNPVRSI